MTDIEKMNRKETIRALRACGTEGGTCEGCPLHDEHAEEPFGGCAPGSLMRHAADVLEASLSVQYE